MTQISKELTDKLLSLVLNCKANLYHIDTITRLMKEWCRRQGYMVSTEYLEDGVGCMLFLKNSRDVYDCVWSTQELKIETEFEAVLQATHFVAKEKGLL